MSRSISQLFILLITTHLSNCINVNDILGDLEPEWAIEEVHTVGIGIGDERTLTNEDWMLDAVLDVAFRLRRHKFTGYDIRRNLKISNLYLNFPHPPLRNTHHEVKKHCDHSFSECLQYLAAKSKESIFNRETISSVNVKKAISADEVSKCNRLLESDEKNFEEFRSNLDRFQWLTSATYYMCWHTLRQHNALEFFGEPCDNFAACPDLEGSYSNGDIRANNNKSYACALYSFCPDPCCSNRLLTSYSECKDNPCGNHHLCHLPMYENMNLDGLMLNQWNLTCRCDEKGTEWNSKSGMCVDIDECRNPLTCSGGNQTCINLPKTFACTCAIGYRNYSTDGHCKVDKEFQFLLQRGHLPSEEDQSEKEEEEEVEDDRRAEELRRLEELKSEQTKMFDNLIKEEENVAEKEIMSDIPGFAKVTKSMQEDEEKMAHISPKPQEPIFFDQDMMATLFPPTQSQPREVPKTSDTH